MHAATDDGWTALMAAARDAEDPAIVHELLAAGAQVEARDRWGTTALMVATGNPWSPAIVTTLLDAGADPEARNESGETAWDLIQNNEALQGTSAYRRLRSLLDQT